MYLLTFAMFYTKNNNVSLAKTAAHREKNMILNQSEYFLDGNERNEREKDN